MQIYFDHLLITLNVPIRISKCTPGGTCTPGWEPLVYTLRVRVENSPRYTMKTLSTVCGPLL